MAVEQTRQSVEVDASLEEKRGIPVYESNPSISGVIADGSEKVEGGQAVSLYPVGCKQVVGLSKAGLAVFEVVYNNLRERPGADTVLLSSRTSNLEERTYQRGLRELLKKEFLFRSPYHGTFFVNIRFMFNGDRLAFVKGYRLKGDAQQGELGLDEPPALPAPEKPA